MKRIADQTLYEILDVRDDATVEEISRACDRARALYGPGSLATYTLMSPEEAALLAGRIEEARTTLLDPAARARYDEALHARAGEARAGRAAMGASTPAPFPPVIPAAAPPPSPPAPDSPHAQEPPPLPMPRFAEEEHEEGEEPERAEPVRLFPPAAEAPPPRAERAVEPPAPPQEPARAPIRLEREIVEPPRPAAPARTPIPAAPPPPPAPLPSVPEGQPWTGDILRQCREARGISIQQIAERTKVTRHHIENIEGERFGALPAPVYLRGILLALARELRLDGQKVARSYLERAAAAKGK